MMTEPNEFDPTLAPELIAVAERLERDRPVPNPGFRGNLSRKLQGRSRQALAADRFRLWATGYTAAGALCLAVAAIGLVGAGPFAA